MGDCNYVPVFLCRESKAVYISREIQTPLLVHFMKVNQHSRQTLCRIRIARGEMLLRELFVDLTHSIAVYG